MFNPIKQKMFRACGDCAAANAALDLFEDGERLEQVAVIEAQLRAALEPIRAIAGVVDVRVKGAIGVVQLGHGRSVQWMRRRFVEEGVWLRPFGDVVYLMPAFTITRVELGRLTDAIAAVLEDWRDREDNSAK